MCVGGGASLSYSDPTNNEKGPEEISLDRTYGLSPSLGNTQGSSSEFIINMDYSHSRLVSELKLVTKLLKMKWRTDALYGILSYGDYKDTIEKHLDKLILLETLAQNSVDQADLVAHELMQSNYKVEKLTELSSSLNFIQEAYQKQVDAFKKDNSELLKENTNIRFITT